MAMVGVRCTCFTFPSSLASFGVLFWSFVRFELQLDCKSVCRAVRNAFDPSEYAANMTTTQCIYMQRGQINTCLYSAFFLLWILFQLLLPICSYFSWFWTFDLDLQKHGFAYVIFVFVKLKGKKITQTQTHPDSAHLAQIPRLGSFCIHAQVGLILRRTTVKIWIFMYCQNLCTGIHYFCIGASTSDRSNRFEKSCNKMRTCLYTRVLMCIYMQVCCVFADRSQTVNNANR